MIKIRYYIFVIRWLWKHRTWDDTRQKYKAIQREWLKKQRSDKHG